MCPLLGGLSSFRVSFIGGFTIHLFSTSQARAESRAESPSQAPSHSIELYLLTAHKQFLSQSPDDELDSISSVLDDSDGVRVEHVFCTVAIDL